MSRLARTLHILAIVSFALIAGSGCGGGGGGGGGTSGAATGGGVPPTLPQPPAPMIQVSTPSLESTALFNDPVAPRTRFTFTSNSELPIRAVTSNLGIESITWRSTGVGLFELEVSYKFPYARGPGSYDDTIRIDACPTFACSSVVATATVTSRYVVQLPTGDASPRVTVSRTAVALDALLTDDLPPPLPGIELTITKVPVAATVRVATTTNAIAFARFFASISGGKVDLVLVGPYRLGAGTHRDTVTVTVCMDPQCIYPLPQSPITIPIEYTVRDTVSGPRGYTIKVLPVKSHDLAWDSSRTRVYLATPDYPGDNANTITLLNPVTGELGPSVAMPDMPGELALSDDGQYLYVEIPYQSEVRRFKLPDFAFDLAIPLGKTPSGSPLSVGDMAVMPGSGRTVAIAKSFDTNSNEPWELGIYDDNVARPVTIRLGYDPINGIMIDHLAWGTNPARFYGASNSAQHLSLYTLNVGADGPSIATTTAGLAGGALNFHEGLLYTDRGRIYDPVSQIILGEIRAPEGGQNVAVIPRGSTPFVVSSWFADGTRRAQLGVYDISTLSQLRALKLHPDMASSLRKSLRWGDEGVVLSSYTGFGYEGGQLVLISGPFFAR